jgi:sugar transferase (PEP-CTERM/EpsH1 system associated)
MRILWVSPCFLHPTERGGQIRTLGILSRLHRHHEIHFAALQLPGQQEGPGRAAEYCTHSYSVPHAPPSRHSLAFLPQLAASLFSAMPLAASRFRSPQLKRTIVELLAKHDFDSIVCDFYSMAPNVPDMTQAVLFQHNVESVIWRRHVENAPTPLHRAFFRLQHKRMLAFEKRICGEARHVITVSEEDAVMTTSLYGVTHVSSTPTGVDVDYYQPPPSADPEADLVFTGSMDWLPNVDGVRHFVNEVLPLLRQHKPDCSLAIVGRDPDPAVAALSDVPGVRVTGRVPDIRPYLWGSKVAVVPLRIGGGTRLKIYEAMAAGIPVVSTSIGAEGLFCRDSENIQIADTPAEMAERCRLLLEDERVRNQQREAALALVRERFTWEVVAGQFEEILRQARLPASA